MVEESAAVTSDDALARAEALLDRLEETRKTLEATDDPEAAIEVMGELARIAKEIEAEIERAKREADAGA